MAVDVPVNRLFSMMQLGDGAEICRAITLGPSNVQPRASKEPPDILMKSHGVLVQADMPQPTIFSVLPGGTSMRAPASMVKITLSKSQRADWSMVKVPRTVTSVKARLYTPKVESVG